jgi:hypothetical protein
MGDMSLGYYVFLKQIMESGNKANASQEMNFKASPIKSMRLLIVSGTLHC